MANRVTRGKALVGDVIPSSGKYVHTQNATVARTDTAAKNLFTLPANATIVAIRVYGATGSDAGTTATLSVGKSGGTGAEYVNAANIKGTNGVGVVSIAAATVLGGIGTSAVTVTGTYAETGTASTTGGAWTVFVDYTV